MTLQVHGEVVECTERLDTAAEWGEFVFEGFLEKCVENLCVSQRPEIERTRWEGTQIHGDIYGYNSLNYDKAMGRPTVCIGGGSGG